MRFSLLADSAAMLHRATMAVAATALVVLFLALFVVVMLRHSFSIGSLPLQDLTVYGFAVVMVLAIPAALYRDRHVRVDVFRRRQSIRSRDWLERVGLAFLLIPLLSFSLYAVWPETVYSWTVREASPQIGGLPFYYIVKTVLPLALIVTILQAMYRLVSIGRSGKPSR